MEKISVNPGRCRVHGNIIGNKYGYLETLNGFQSHKCEISRNANESQAYEEFDVFSFTLTKNENLINRFIDDIAYCKPTDVSTIGSFLYVCEHFENTFDPVESIATIQTFTNGYKIVVKDEYIKNDRDTTAPFYMLIHQNGTGVAIPSGTSRITFSTTYEASPAINSIKVGFVYFDKNHNYIRSQEVAEIASVGTGNRGRCNVQSTNIPSNAKYVSIEFSFPNGVGRYINNAGELKNDYFSMELNTLLFNQTYGGFVTNG